MFATGLWLTFFCEGNVLFYFRVGFSNTVCYYYVMMNATPVRPTPFRRTFDLVMNFEDAMREGRVEEAAKIEKRACANSPGRKVWFEMSRQLLADGEGVDEEEGDE